MGPVFFFFLQGRGGFGLNDLKMGSDMSKSRNLVLILSAFLVWNTNLSVVSFLIFVGVSIFFRILSAWHPRSVAPRRPPLSAGVPAASPPRRRHPSADAASLPRRVRRRRPSAGVPAARRRPLMTPKRVSRCLRACYSLV